MGTVTVDIIGCKGHYPYEETIEILLGVLVPPKPNHYSYMGEYAERKVFAQCIFSMIVKHSGPVRVEIEDDPQARLELNRDYWFTVVG